MARRKPLAVGDRVRLRRAVALEPGARKAATIRIEIGYIAGGVVLDAPLERFRYWNVTDLERAPASRRNGLTKND